MRRLNRRADAHLDLQILDDRFDHEVAIFEPCHVVFKITDRDERCSIGREERGGLRALRRVESSLRDAVAHGARLKGQTFRPLIRREFARRDVQEEDGDSGVRQMRGDLRAHRTCAQHRRSFNPKHRGRTSLQKKVRASRHT